MAWSLRDRVRRCPRGTTGDGAAIEFGVAERDDDLPPAEFEAAHYQQLEESAMAA
jgi:hypothetical protein